MKLWNTLPWWATKAPLSQGSNVTSGRELRLWSDYAVVLTDLNLWNLYIMLDMAHIYLEMVSRIVAQMLKLRKPT